MVEVPSLESRRIADVAKLRTFSAGWTILRAIVGERFRPLPEPILTRRALEPSAPGRAWPTYPPMVALPVVADTPT